MKQFAVAAACAMAVWQASGVDVIPVANSGFELPALGSGVNWQKFNAGAVIGSGAGGWTVTEGSVDVVSAFYGGNNQSLDLNGLEPGAIKQSFTGLSLGLYELSFRYSGNFHDVPMISPKVIEGYGFVLNVPLVGNVSNPQWNLFTTTFVLQPGNFDLVFKSLSSGNGGPLIDEVSFTRIAVPEPYQYGLASVLGLLGLVTFDRIRQRRLFS